MLIDCICGESKFAVNAEQIGFDGRLVKCGKCGKEWFQQSKLEVIEKKLINVDQALHAKEIKLANERNYYSDKISSLEKELDSKNREIQNQKLVEQRLALFESRVKDSESELLMQKKNDERIATLTNELEKKTLDLFIKNTALEKRSVELQELLSDKSLDERLSSLEQQLIKKKVGGRVINTNKPIEVFDKEDGSEMKPFELDEIEIIKKSEKNGETTIQPEKKDATAHTHADDEDTARIGREGDPLKRKKI